MAGSDSFASRPDLPAGQVAFDTSGATLEAGEDNYTVAGAGSLWWQFTATATDKVTLSATLNAADASATYIRLTLYVDNGATDAAGAMTALFAGAFVSVGETQEILDLSATAGKTYWISVEGLNATGTVGWTHPTEVLIPGPWITPDVQERGVACGRRIWQEHLREYDEAGTQVREVWNQADEDPRSGPGNPVDPWRRSERKAINEGTIFGATNETQYDFCTYVWMPVDFPQVTGPQPPGAVGVEYEALEGALVPGQVVRLVGQLRLGPQTYAAPEQTINPEYDSGLGRASSAGYTIDAAGAIQAPAGADGVFGSPTPPSPNLGEALTGAELVTTSGLQAGIDGAMVRKLDVELGQFDASGAIAAYLAPTVRTMPSLPAVGDGFGAVTRLEQVDGNDSNTWAPPPIKYLYQPPRYRWLFPDLPRPLRQRQRQDGLAISAPRQFTRNRPKSKQISVRAGWEGTYL